MTKIEHLLALRDAKTKSDIGYHIDHIEAYHPVGLYSHMLSKAECVIGKEQVLESHKELVEEHNKSLKNKTV